MNKAKLLEQLRALVENAHIESYADGVESAIELVEQLTCIADPTFPTVIKEPVPLRDYGVLYLVKDASNDMYYITKQDDWLLRDEVWEKIEKAWTMLLHGKYPETRETK